MKKLTGSDVRAACQAVDYKNGEAYYRDGKVTGTWQTASSLHASVAGSGKRPYRVSIADEAGKLAPTCTCPAHRRRPFCKHVAAVLVAWAENPHQFAQGTPPPAAASPRPQSQVQRAHKPAPTAADRKQVQLDGLAKVEELLVELASYGLLSPTEAQAARVADLAHTAESHKLRRLARLVTRLGLVLEAARAEQAPLAPGKAAALRVLAAAFPGSAATIQAAAAQIAAGQSTAQQVDEAVYAELLSDAWLTTQATRRALQDHGADPTTLEDLVGKTWREKELERREGVRLLELAYETLELDTGFTVDTSYLLSLGDGEIYTEKQIVPSRFRNKPRKASYSGLLAGTVGIYPGAGLRRVKLLEMAPEAPATDQDWAQAVACAERSVAGLFRRFQTATASPLAPPEAYALFAPERIFVDGAAVWLLDEDGLAIEVADGWHVTGHVARQPLAAILGRLAAAQASLKLSPLGLISLSPEARLLR